VLLKVGQVQRRRPRDGEVGTLAEPLRLVQPWRHERQAKSFGGNSCCSMSEEEHLLRRTGGMQCNATLEARVRGMETTYR
jgi:hypothetical protein